MMKNPIILLFFLVFTGCASLVYQAEDYEALYGPSTPKQRRLTEEDAALSQRQNKVSFYQDVKPILDSRCVVRGGTEKLNSRLSGTPATFECPEGR